uniref:LPS responsive beige-like anchor protein n=1 Tax=Rousettus aegyptiacus TaxID=9407 RepID=A0A7J8BS20_ROUAE|nr:LPS responsive beige-like anchor protein [Rousettus aegyptiacus]
MRNLRMPHTFLFQPGTSRIVPAKNSGEQGCSTIYEVVTTEYTISIHKHIHRVSYKKYGPWILRETQKFAMKKMGTPDVCMDIRLNKAVWANGIRHSSDYISALFRRPNKVEESPHKF